MRFLHVPHRQVDAIRSIQKLEDVHLEMNPIDTANSDTVMTWSLSLQGRLDFDSLVDRISDTILSNPNFIRFRSSYDLNTNGWIPIDGWTARQNTVCHDDHEDPSMSEAHSIKMVQTMDNGYAWVCHLQYQPATDETIVRWILNHGLGDVYAIRLVLLSLLDHDPTLLPPPLSTSPKSRVAKFHHNPYTDRKLSKYLRPLSKMSPSENKRRIHPQHPIEPIEFPTLNLEAIERLAKEQQVGIQDVLIYLVAETKQRIGEQDDEWIWSPIVNPRWDHQHHHHHQVDRMDNLATSLPVYIGKNGGDPRSIHNSTNILQESISLIHKHSETQNNTAPPSHEDRIHSVTCLLAGHHPDRYPTIFDQRIQSMRFHVHRPNEFCFAFNGSCIETTFTIQSSPAGANRGALVYQAFLKIAQELHLLSD